MSDDWRLRIDLHDQGHARELIERLEAAEPNLAGGSDERIAVSRDAAQVFCYAATRAQAERVEELINSLAADHGWHVEHALERWHPAAESWEDPDEPLPQTDAELAGERAALMQREREEAAGRGPEFELRVQCSSHAAAVELAERLEREGVPSVRRWKYLLIGATDEDSANALAERVRQEAPDSTVTVEGTLQAVLADQPSNPFAILGGLGG